MEEKKIKDLTIKHRPTTWEEVVGQDKTISVLKNEVITDQIANSYIFTGKSGVGKTTIARLFFKAINCLDINYETGNPCNMCENCKNFEFQFLEIDGATNRGIDEVKKLQEGLNFKSLFGHTKYKGILIDEAHQLSIAAWNALLKSIEEPPEYVVWFFCTTEFYKIPKTIQTRCQIFKLNPIRYTDIYNKLKDIAEKEKISLDDKVLWKISEMSDNNVRQAIHLLEKYIVSGEIDDNEKEESFLTLLQEEDYKKLWEFFDKWDKKYESIEHFINSIKLDLSNMIKLSMGINIKTTPYRLKKYKSYKIGINKLQKLFIMILEIEKKIRGVYDYNSLFLELLLKMKDISK